MNTHHVTSFDLTGPLPTGRTLIEASAGTGKTYSIAALVARYVAGDLAVDGHTLQEGLDVGELLVVTYTRAAAAELRDRIRAKLRLAADHLDGRPGQPVEEWLRVFDRGGRRVRQRRRARLGAAVARFDEATITTIHGFCQQALAQCGLRSGVDRRIALVEDSRALVAEVCRDVLIDRLADDPLALSTDAEGRPVEPGRIEANRQPMPPARVESSLVSTVLAVLGNPGAGRRPAPEIGGIAGAWADAVDTAVRAVDRRQRSRRQIGYDRLITDLDDLLADPVGGRQLAEQLAARYRVVLVDEFQDTDRVQWAIFERAFAGHRLITVGDPKQAIYRFRGADVHAYLAAAADAGTARSTLRTNYRSDQQLLDALAVLFHGAELGHEAIAFAHVDPAPDAAHNALGDEAPVQVRVVADDGALPRTRDGLEAGAVARVVLTDVASRVRSLLDTATIESPTGQREVRPRDIGVLVPSQRRAGEAAEVLREWGIPSVRARTGSVLLSEAAMQWRLLLAGLARPTNARTARAAGLSWFFDLDPVQLVGDGATGGRAAGDEGDSPLVELQRRLAVLAARLGRDGVGPLYEQLRAESALLGVVLPRPTGDRDLADLDHLAELLAAAVRGAGMEPARVAELLDSLIAGADDQSEETMRRVETDDDAVHITTIHSAKGLEYPIVLLPFAYAPRPNANRPYIYNGADGRRVIDVASWVAWADDHPEGSQQALAAAGERKARAIAEIDGDGLRLLYVAATRAMHRLELWWAPTARAATSAFGRLLLDRQGAGPVHNSPPRSDFQREAAAAGTQLDALVAASNGTIARFEVPVDQPVRHPLALGERAARLLAVAGTGRRHPLTDPAWRTWSFTAITRQLDGAAGRPEPPIAGGGDEPVAADDAAIPGPPSEVFVEEPTEETAPTEAMPLVAVPGGTTFGTMVHEVLERVDPTSPTLDTDVAVLVATGIRRSGLPIDTAAVGRGLVAAIDTPLGPLFDGRPLRAIAPEDRLAELAFDLALADGGVAAAAFGKVLTATLPDGDPLSPYGAELAAELHPLSVAGWLTGSIDAVFRIGDGSRQRFVVVDYKSNRLHGSADADPLAAYRPDQLVAAMTHSHYPLQALLYSVALHRYLAWRLGGDYQPEQHLGGIAYLFVRGMIGAATPTFEGAPSGVFSWHPPAATVLALDELIGGGQR